MARSRVTRALTSRDRLYIAALRKYLLAEHLRPDEAKELKRRRLAGGALPTPAPDDAMRQLAFAHLDPRLG